MFLKSMIASLSVLYKAEVALHPLATVRLVVEEASLG